MVPIAVLLLYALHVHDGRRARRSRRRSPGSSRSSPRASCCSRASSSPSAPRASARRGALVQRLPAVESLAGVDVVCVDKTGTLTDGTLAVEEIVPISGADGREVRAAARRSSPRASAGATRPRMRCTPSSAGRRRPSRSRCRSPRAGSGAGSCSATAPSSCWERPRSSCAAEHDPALAEEISVRQDRRLRVLLFARADGLAEPEGDDEPLAPRARAPRRSSR